MKPFAICVLILGLAVVEFHGAVKFDETAAAQQPKPAVEGVAVRYARAYLRLTELELKSAKNTNAKVPGVISAVEVDRLKMNVAVAQAQLQNALRPNAVSKVQVHLRYAEEKVATARKEYKRAQRVRKINAEALSDDELERLKLVMEVAQYRLEMWRDPTYLPSLLDHMQWQIDRLSEEIVQLHKRTQMLK